MSLNGPAAEGMQARRGTLCRLAGCARRRCRRAAKLFASFPVKAPLRPPRPERRSVSTQAAVCSGGVMMPVQKRPRSSNCATAAAGGGVRGEEYQSQGGRPGAR